MKINLLNSNKPYLSGSGAVPKDPQAFKERTAAGLCAKKNETREYSVSFSGNPTAKVSEVAAKSFGDKILSSKTFGAILEYADDHTVACNALFALAFAGILRPATIMALPDEISGKNKKDKLNAAAHGISSGILGFITSTIIMSPFDAAMKKIKKDPAKYLGEGAKKYLGDLKAKGLTKTPKFKNVEKLIKMGPDIIIGIPRAWITIALIPPILKYVFGMDPAKDKKKEKEMKSEDKDVDMSKLQMAGAPVNSSAFDAIRGGVR